MNMKTRLPSIALLCLASLSALFAQPGAERIGAVDPLASAGAGRIKAELVAVHSGDGRYISVSPDGGKVAVADGRVIRILDSSTMEVLADTADAAAMGAAFDANSFCWSPDSRRAALTEDFIRLFRDSDLWILDIEGGGTTRLFADEIKDILRADEGDAVIAPAWAPDGDGLFATLFDYPTRTSAIVRADDLDDRGAKVIYEESSGSGASIWSGLHVSGDYLYFSRDAGKRNDAGDGIYRMDLSGGGRRRILGPDGIRGEPILIALGADGKYALASHLAYANSYSSDFLNPVSGEYESGIFLIDLSDFSTRPLTTWDKPESPLRANYAAFSADGGKVVYVVSEPSAGHRLMIQDSRGGDGYALYPSEGIGDRVFGTMSLRNNPPIFWTSDNKLFVIGANGLELYEFKLSLR